MKILVIFGSVSDKHIYEPFIDTARKQFEVRLVIASAHRDPALVEQTVLEGGYDVIVAGAGLAAHLPGVVASKTTVPVFGIPVAANFNGLDAFLSILQMPRGVPVLTVAPGNEMAIISFLINLKNGSEVKTALVEKSCDVVRDGCAINVPAITKEGLMKTETALELLELVKTGGVWVGVNNMQNGELVKNKLVELAKGGLL